MAKISIIPWIVKKLKRCIGIVEDTDTASQAIASNKYVIWKGDVCKSTSAISEGDTLSSSNLSAVNGGVGNDLSQAIANLNDLVVVDLTSTIPSTLTPTRCDQFFMQRRGNTVTVTIWNLSFNAAISSDTVVGQLPFQLTRPVVFAGWDRTNRPINGFVSTTGAINIRNYVSDLMYISFTFIIQ